MAGGEFYKLTHNIDVVGGGDLKTSSDGITSLQTLADPIRGNYIRISYFAKPSSGTMTPKFRLYFYRELLEKWAQGDLIEGEEVLSTSDGETIDLKAILIGPGKVAVLLEECEEGGQLMVEVERFGMSV